MYIPFASMPPHARLWVYQSNRRLTSDEVASMRSGLHDWCDQWKAHGSPLQTSFEIVKDQFVILAVDEAASGVSGCSIDGSVRYLKSIQENGIDFFDRTRVAFLLEDGSVVTHPLREVKPLLEKGTLSSRSVTFNNLVATKAEWSEKWQVSLKESWLASHLPKSEVEG